MEIDLEHVLRWRRGSWVGVRCVGVIQIVFLVLQILFDQVYLPHSMVKHQQNSDFKLDFPLFSYDNQKGMYANSPQLCWLLSLEWLIEFEVIVHYVLYMSLMVYILCSTANHPPFRCRCLIKKSNLLREDVKGWENNRLKRDNGNCRGWLLSSAKGLYELLSCTKIYLRYLTFEPLESSVVNGPYGIYTKSTLKLLSSCWHFLVHLFSLSDDFVWDNQYRIFTTPQHRSVGRDESLHVEVIFWIVESAPIRIKLILLPNDARAI
jgi:hypothetical protein